MPTRKNPRLKGYDYSLTGYYFVTICIHKDINLLGEIVGDQMQLNDFGETIKLIWDQLPTRYPIEMDAFVIMPNHIHGIIKIIGAVRAGFPGPQPMRNLIDRQMAGKPSPYIPSPNPRLGQIIAYFKYETTRSINKSRNTPGVKLWHRNYYDRILRNENELKYIRQYIINNPIMWRAGKPRPYTSDP